MFAFDHIIYDQSDDPIIIDKIKKNKDLNIIFTPNTGHNLLVYFKYIIDNYENLPEIISFIKGSMIGRHMTKEYWESNYNNKFYTLLWNDLSFISQENIAYSLYSGIFMERNNSWFIDLKKHRYFTDVNQLLSFFYNVNEFPKFNLFAPGGCYIVEKERIMRYPKSFYIGIHKILEYDFFPSEAYIIERIMNIIFTADWQLHSYVFDEKELLNRIDQLPDLSNYNPKHLKRSRLRLSMIYILQLMLKLLDV